MVEFSQNIYISKEINFDFFLYLFSFLTCAHLEFRTVINFIHVPNWNILIQWASVIYRIGISGYNDLQSCTRLKFLNTMDFSRHVLSEFLNTMIKSGTRLELLDTMNFNHETSGYSKIESRARLEFSDTMDSNKVPTCNRLEFLYTMTFN